MSPVSILRDVLAIVREVVPLFRREPKPPARPNITKPPLDPHIEKANELYRLANKPEDVERITAKRRAMKPRQP